MTSFPKLPKKIIKSVGNVLTVIFNQRFVSQTLFSIFCCCFCCFCWVSEIPFLIAIYIRTDFIWCCQILIIKLPIAPASATIQYFKMSLEGTVWNCVVFRVYIHWESMPLPFCLWVPEMSSCCLVMYHVVQYSLHAHVHGPSDYLYLDGVETFWCGKGKRHHWEPWIIWISRCFCVWHHSSFTITWNSIPQKHTSIKKSLKWSLV